jgi:hypothetical protein
MPALACPACHKKHPKKAKYCSNCGSNFSIAEKHDSVSSTFPKEILHFIFHINTDFFKTFWKLFRKPGHTLITLVHEKNKYKSVYYFLASLSLYIILREFVLKYPRFKYQLSNQFEAHIAPFILIGLLIIIALIGYITLGWWRFKPGDKDNYSFSEVFVICLYIYGTNYLLAPAIIIVSHFFDDSLIRFDPKVAGKITDIPLDLYMAFMLFMLVKRTSGYKYRYLRFTAFLVIAGAYYLLMYNKICMLNDFLHDLLEGTSERHVKENIIIRTGVLTHYTNPIPKDTAPNTACDSATPQKFGYLLYMPPHTIPAKKVTERVIQS